MASNGLRCRNEFYAPLVMVSIQGRTGNLPTKQLRGTNRLIPLSTPICFYETVPLSARETVFLLRLVSVHLTDGEKLFLHGPIFLAPTCQSIVHRGRRLEICPDWCPSQPSWRRGKGKAQLRAIVNSRCICIQTTVVFKIMHDVQIQ